MNEYLKEQIINYIKEYGLESFMIELCDMIKEDICE